MNFEASWTAVAWMAAVLVGCSSPAMDQPCRVGADCASGVCLADGTCQAVTIDGGSDGDTFDAVPGCGDHDGVIARAEQPLEVGAMARFRVGLDAAVSTAGVTNPDGSRTWELQGSMSGDHDVVFETLAIAGTWFASTFPTASFAARISDDPNLLGVYRATSSALALMGVVSISGGLSRTELTYAPAVELLRFPLGATASWSEAATVSGLLGGFASLYTERFDVAVDATGTAVTPAGSFPVLRLGTVLTRTVGLLPPTVVRTYQLDAECVGFVGTLVSNEDEPNVEFTTAAEAWRLGP